MKREMLTKANVDGVDTSLSVLADEIVIAPNDGAETDFDAFTLNIKLEKK